MFKLCRLSPLTHQWGQGSLGLCHGVRLWANGARPRTVHGTEKELNKREGQKVSVLDFASHDFCSSHSGLPLGLQNSLRPSACE